MANKNSIISIDYGVGQSHAAILSVVYPNAIVKLKAFIDNDTVIEDILCFDTDIDIMTDIADIALTDFTVKVINGYISRYGLIKNDKGIFVNIELNKIKTLNIKYIYCEVISPFNDAIIPLPYTAFKSWNLGNDIKVGINDSIIHDYFVNGYMCIYDADNITNPYHKHRFIMMKIMYTWDSSVSEAELWLNCNADEPEIYGYNPISSGMLSFYQSSDKKRIYIKCSEMNILIWNCDTKPILFTQGLKNEDTEENLVRVNINNYKSSLIPNTEKNKLFLEGKNTIVNNIPYFNNGKNWIRGDGFFENCIVDIPIGVNTYIKFNPKFNYSYKAILISNAAIQEITFVFNNNRISVLNTNINFTNMTIVPVLIGNSLYLKVFTHFGNAKVIIYNLTDNEYCILESVSVDNSSEEEFSTVLNSGDTSKRPNIENNKIPVIFYYNLELHQFEIISNGVAYDVNGNNADFKKSGTFEERPMYPKTGYSYLCTDRKTTEGNNDGIVIYYKGNDVWVDALGRVVE